MPSEHTETAESGHRQGEGDIAVPSPASGPVGRLLATVESATDTAAAAGMFATMGIVAMDVVMRYVLHSPFAWAPDLLTLYLIPGMFFLGLPGSYANGAHIAVDILVPRLSPPTRLRILLLGRVLTLILFALLVIFGTERLMEAIRDGEVQPSITLNWLIWPSAALVPLGALLVMLRAAERLLVEACALIGATRTAASFPLSDGSVMK